MYIHVYMYIYIYIYTSDSKFWVNKKKIALKINLNELVARGVRYIPGGEALWGHHTSAGSSGREGSEERVVRDKVVKEREVQNKHWLCLMRLSAR